MKIIRRTVKMMMTVGVLLALVSSICGCSLLTKEKKQRKSMVQNEEEKSLYQYYKVGRDDITVVAELYCSVLHSEKKNLRFQEAGLKYGPIYVSVGDKVKKGQLLAELDMEDVSEELSQSKDDYEQAKLELSHIDTQLRDLEKECKIQNMTVTQTAKETLDLRNLKTETQSNYTIANCKYKELLKEQKKRQIVAPSDGIVSYVIDLSSEQAHKQQEPVSDASRNVISISNTGYKYEAYTEMYKSFSKGMTVNMYIDKQCYKMQVEDVIGGYEGYGEVELGDIILSFIDKPTNLNPDACGVVKETVKQVKNVICVPAGCVTEMGKQKSVYVINKDGVRELRKVKIGVTDGNMTEIKSGLQEGEKVITN